MIAEIYGAATPPQPAGFIEPTRARPVDIATSVPITSIGREPTRAERTQSLAYALEACEDQSAELNRALATVRDSTPPEMRAGLAPIQDFADGRLNSCTQEVIAASRGATRRE